MTIEICPYRAQRRVCRLDSRQCEPCLQGQLIDAVELNTSAIMEAIFDDKRRK